MKYNSFSIENKKQEKLWNFIKNQERILSNPAAIKRYLKNADLNEPIIKLFESEYQSIPLPKSGEFPLTSGSFTEALGGEVGCRFNYEFQIDNVEIPEYALPFLNFQVIGKTIPGSRFLPLHYWQRHFSNLIQDVVVNGDLIYHGVGNSTQFTRFTQADIDSGRVNEDALKKVFLATRTGQGSGFVNRVIVTYDRVNGTGDCLGQVSRKEIVIDYHLQPHHRLTSMTTSGFTGIGNLTEFIYTDIGASCDETIINHVTNGNVSLNWSAAQTISIRVENSAGIVTATLSLAPTSVVDSGFWLYFGTDKYPPRVGFTTVGSDITLTQTPTTDVGLITVTPTIEPATQNELEPNNGKELCIFQLNESPTSGSLKKYRIHVGGEAVVIAQAQQLDITQYTSEKINTFIWNGTTFEYDESLSGSFSRPRYKFSSQDVQLKLLVTLKNPFYFRTEDRVQKNERV